MQINTAIITGNTTGNFATNSVQCGGATSVTAFVTLTYGGTPTITAQLQGSNDGVGWSNTGSAGTWTSGSPQIISKAVTDIFQMYRINFTLNTNVTVTKAWISATGPGAV